MPSIVSTPPRVRIRSKTMTSASNQQQSSQSSRPSALRKPNRGRSKERNVVRKSLSTELAEVASQKEASRSRSKKVVSPRKLKKKEKKRQEEKEKETERKRQEENEKEKVKEKKRQEEKEKEKKREVEKEKAKEKKRQDEKEKEKKLQEEKEKENKAKEKKRQEEKEKEKKLQEEKEKEKAKEKKRQDEKEKEKKLQDEKEKENKAKEKKRQEEKEKEKKLQEEKEKEKETEKKRHEEKEKEGKKKKKDSAIVFEPAKRSKIEHIFEAPPETSTPSTPLTSKQKAEAQFAKLAEHLVDSDSDSVPATDLEAFAGKVGQVAQGSDEDGEEGSESEDESEEAQGEEEKTEVPNQDGEGKDAASSSEEESEDSTEEGEEEEECTEDEASSEEEGGENEGGETKKKKTGEGEAGSHALVPVTDATASQTLALRNSMTHKKEWDSFVRSAKTKMPIGLNDMYLSSKQELFSLWLDHNKDWGACSLEIERRQEQQNVAKRGWQAVQGKVLKSRYSQEKWQHILASRKAAGLYYEDEDFPGDDDDSRLNQVKLCFPIQITAKPSLIVFLRPKPDQVKTQSFKIVSG